MAEDRILGVLRRFEVSDFVDGGAVGVDDDKKPRNFTRSWRRTQPCRLRIYSCISR
jgi:hypothetical protein